MRSRLAAQHSLCLLLVLCCGLNRIGLASEPPSDSNPQQAEGLKLFKDHVRPALIQHCGGCHSGDEVEGEFDLGTREGLLRGGLSKDAILPGDHRNSLLYKLITHEKKPRMPAEADRLPEELIAQIARWIDLGAPYDAPLVMEAAQPAWTQKQIDAASREHWAYQPLQRVTLPAAPPASETTRETATGETTNGIDRFVLEKLTAQGLVPNAPASRRQFIRRVYLDVIGLPPTPAEIHEFLQDESPQAYERIIDRLLASPHYGEKWARHWLDLVRFAESHGFEHDYDRPTAYHYRDFVIQALNSDLPYDVFVKWQLAGDELAPDCNLALMATGYLAAGVHSTQITANEVEKHRYDEMDDMLATTGTAMLGLTVGCARCHDHKYDAIPQADYYRMLATFATTVRAEVDLDTDPDGYRQAVVKFDAEHAPLVDAWQQYRQTVLPEKFREWEQTGQGLPTDPDWLILDQLQATSTGGATLVSQPDGSWLATEKKPDQDTYIFQARTNLPNLTGIRLEALADSSLVKSGPGRGDNGNFALTEFKVTAAPADRPTELRILKLVNPRATFEQPGLPVSAAIDDNAGSGWAVDPEFGKSHAAAFEFGEPLQSAEEQLLTITLEFKNNVRHAIGRPRLSVSTAASTADQPVPLLGSTASGSVIAALRTPVEKRSPADVETLLNWFGTQDAEAAKLQQAIHQHLANKPQPKMVKALVSSEGLPPLRLHTQGADFFPVTYFLRRGDTGLKDGEAAPGFLQALIRTDRPDEAWPANPPQGARTSYRRTAFANWMTDVDHGAGALLARVMVNRLWQQHFGRGLVATVSDFGVRGAPPSHPELLDWLAQELIRNEWRLKPLHRLMLLSATYRQSSQLDSDKLQVDPDNQWLWRRPRRRLEAENLRDSILYVGGLLDRQMYGPGTLDVASNRRSIYFTIKRSQLISMLQVFDCPDGLSGIGERQATTVAPQALLLLNNPRVRDACRQLATQLWTHHPEERHAIEMAYETTLARLPLPQELEAAAAFLANQTKSHQAAGHTEPQLLALADFCQILICLNEFVYVD